MIVAQLHQVHLYTKFYSWDYCWTSFGIINVLSAVLVAYDYDHLFKNKNSNTVEASQPTPISPAGHHYNEQICDGEVGKRRTERSAMCIERQSWRRPWWQVWERAEVDSGTGCFPVGPTGWCAAAWGLCRHRLSPQTHCQTVGSPWLCSMMEAQDEKQFTF